MDYPSQVKSVGPSSFFYFICSPTTYLGPSTYETRD